MNGLHQICTSFLHHFYDMDLQMSIPILNNFKYAQYMDFQLGTTLFTVIFFMFVIDVIVIYSMMLTDVEERTYEFAMLRCLGFQNGSLIVLLLIQALFFSLPATAIGFILLNLFTSAAQVGLYQKLGISLQVPVHQSTVWLGLLTGVLIPLISNIYPIKQALGTKLRDALDRFRQGIDETEVQFLRMENAGFSTSQVGLGLAIVSTSYLTLIMIPHMVLIQQPKDVYFRMNFVLIGIIIGLIFMSQSLVPKLARLILEIIFRIIPGDKMLAPLIHKNLESHALKNMKANMMYCVTICFLVYSGTCFMSTEKFLRQSSHVIFGGDITLKSVAEHDSAPILDEFKIRSTVEPMLEKNGGVIESYTLLGSNIAGQMTVSGREPIKEYLLGTGLIQKKSQIGRVTLQAVEPNTLDAVNKSLVWYPSEILS